MSTLYGREGGGGCAVPAGARRTCAAAQWRGACRAPGDGVRPTDSALRAQFVINITGAGDAHTGTVYDLRNGTSLIYATVFFSPSVADSASAEAHPRRRLRLLVVTRDQVAGRSGCAARAREAARDISR